MTTEVVIGIVLGMAFIGACRFGMWVAGSVLWAVEKWRGENNG